jgi:hypothetical protein
MKIFTSLLLMISFNILSAEGNNDGRHHGPHGGGPKFTDEQKACLKNILGEPGSGERPTREKMEAAMKSCGIEKPAFPPKDDEKSSN